jgi:hypothetical protein
MKLLIAGSRSINTFDLSEYISFDVDLIICGGADGVDRIAEQYADDNKISKLVLKPQYKIYGKAAPIKRNELMVDIADKVPNANPNNEKEIKLFIGTQEEWNAFTKDSSVDYLVFIVD